MDWECCWKKNEILPEECPLIAKGEEELYSDPKRRIVEKCLECPRFRNDLASFSESGHPFAYILPFIIEKLIDNKALLDSLGGFLNSKTREIRFLHEINLVLQSSLDLDEILSIAMTAITAGKGFGMNRAFLLLVDKERLSLNGYLGIGPRNYEEAWQIWQEIGEKDFSLREMARNFRKTKLASEKVKFSDLLEKLTVPLSDQQHIFNQSMKQRSSFLVEDAFNNADIDPELARLLGVDSFFLMPLISRNRRVGLIIADNFITHKKISQNDIQLMEIFSFPVAFAIERASLYERLQEEVDKLTAANAKLKEQQELIVKMEKMALVGRVTSSIAHSIRNPLMIIGGFARALMKNTGENEKNRHHLDSIVREAKQLEDVLDEILIYSDSLHPALDRWDINQLISTVTDQYQKRLARKGIGYTLDLAGHLPMAHIDYKQIAFAIRTILSAGMDSLGVNNIVLKSALDGEDILVEIMDNGTSYDPEPLEEPSTPASAARELGTNFGLPLCRTIIEKYGHPFIVEELPERGTKYAFRLPVTKEEN